ncbi:MAG: TIGR03960 family B12-binding radical SAM protein [Geobacteraceae bacterium]|nr:TIGR03960 family B12-binding radical SAM protein [Geobacteraceae bacterium]
MIDSSLLNVDKPARYMGGEVGIIRKEVAEIRFVLAFPDVYEIGMSHLGFQILYNILNSHDWLAAERIYSPWPDREDQLKAGGAMLTTLESGLPLADVDIIGFTLQHELSYTNIVNMLRMSRIPLLAEERLDTWPLVLGGGPCAYNPEPLADFFDAFLIGDGEEAVCEIAALCREAKKNGTTKSDLLEKLAEIAGVYVPSFFRVEYLEDGRLKEIIPLKMGIEKVRRRFLADLESAPYPTAPVIPFMKTVHDRVSMEIGRGCTRGCRFCQAGYIYRPLRERSPEKILESVAATLKHTGYEEVSLLSLAAGDYGCLTPLLKELMNSYAESRIAISLPSLRVGTLSEELVEEVKKVRKTGLTLAPEAGSERLRQVINKGITEDALLQDANAAFSAGWRLIKLYFMIGLPTENMADIEAIVDLSKRVKSEGRASKTGGDVNVSVSSFVPKAHTPFQWEEQISYEGILQKQEYLRNELKKRKLKFKWHDAPLSVVEGAFARGDRRLGKVLVEAVELGCRFDSWGDHFSFSKWQKAFATAGIDPRYYLRARGIEEVLPWDHIDSGVSREFLLKERALSMDGVFTADCRNNVCTGCGVCDFKEVKNHLAAVDGELSSGQSKPLESSEAAQDAVGRIRVRYSKIGKMIFLSHLELLTLFIRAVKRADIPVKYSQGFHPHPKFSFATALSVGVESSAEYLDIEVAPDFTADSLKKALNGSLPEGISVLEAWKIDPKSPTLSMIMDTVRYRVTVPENAGIIDLAAGAARFMELDSYPFFRVKKNGEQHYDLRHELHDLTVDSNSLTMEIGRGKPLEFVSAITGTSIKDLEDCRIEKLEVIFKDSFLHI